LRTTLSGPAVLPLGNASVSTANALNGPRSAWRPGPGGGVAPTLPFAASPNTSRSLVTRRPLPRDDRSSGRQPSLRRACPGVRGRRRRARPDEARRDDGGRRGVGDPPRRRAPGRAIPLELEGSLTRIGRRIGTADVLALLRVCRAIGHELGPGNARPDQKHRISYRVNSGRRARGSPIHDTRHMSSAYRRRPITGSS
jgi:hypothetical protein